MPSTGENGYLCRSVYVIEKLEIQKQFFLQITLDRNLGCPVIKFSKHGNMNYAYMNKFYPDDIHEVHVDYLQGLSMT
jgi:succinyl-CoA synthetase beta subunit